MAVERLCPQCGKTHKVKRITKVYCSTLCRVNAFYAARRKLVQLPQQSKQPQLLEETQ